MIRNMIFIFMGFLFLLYSCGKDSMNVQTYPIPDAAVRSKIYSLSVNGKPVFVQKFKDVNYAHFSFTGNAAISVQIGEPVGNYNISPHHYSIKGKPDGAKLNFSLDRPGKLVVRINDNERLFIFADSIDHNAPDPESPEVWSIMEYGVKNDGKTLQTQKIQHAVDDVSAKGGILYFPPGVYLTGTLSIKSNVTVYLAGGAVIQGSPSREDYPVDPGFKESDMKYDPENWSNKGERMTYSRLILVDNAENVKIFGCGVIDGNGKTIRDQGKPANLIRVRNSKNVLVDGLILRDPAAWNTHIIYSENVTFRNIKMINDRTVKNTDGIDPDASKHILIDGCFMYCSDDNIAIKTSRNSGLLQDVDDITVKNCVFLTKKSAMKLGTETFADYEKNVTFENNDIVEADRAMSLYCMDGARFENIRWLNCRVEGYYPDNQQRLCISGSGTGMVRVLVISKMF